MSLDLYTRQCSLGITAEQLSIAAATIANDGVNPVTKKLVFDASLSPKITSLVATVGFYERTGDWGSCPDTSESPPLRLHWIAPAIR